VRCIVRIALGGDVNADTVQAKQLLVFDVGGAGFGGTGMCGVVTVIPSGDSAER
jgi:hypothetical protein